MSLLGQFMGALCFARLGVVDSLAGCALRHSDREGCQKLHGSLLGFSLRLIQVRTAGAEPVGIGRVT